MLTQETVNNLFDYKDGKLYWKVCPNRKVQKGSEAGTKRKDGYRVVRINGKGCLSHRLIWLMHHSNLPKFIDHIDGNTENNMIENLREATHSENMHNLKTPKHNTSGIKNVSFDKSRKKWFVSIRVNDVMKNLGRYDDLELAELVAVEARHKYHGEFARHN